MQYLVYPTHRRLKGRKVRDARRRLSGRLEDYQAGRISFAEFDASVQGWVDHVCYADSWGLRRKILGDLVLRPMDIAKLKNRPRPLRGLDHWTALQRPEISDQPSGWGTHSTLENPERRSDCRD